MQKVVVLTYTGISNLIQSTAVLYGGDTDGSIFILLSRLVGGILIIGNRSKVAMARSTELRNKHIATLLSLSIR